MVLPWISDLNSPAQRDGLLGCPFFDTGSNKVIFASDKIRSIGIRQLPFYKVSDLVFRNTSSQISENNIQMKQLVKTYNNCYFPASLIKDHKRSFNYNLPKYYKPNLITVAKNSLHNSQYCSIYPYRSKGIVIDYLNEIELESNQSALSLFDRNIINPPFMVNNIKSHDGQSFLVSSDQILRLYSHFNGLICDVFEFSSPHNEPFSSVDISRNDLEVVAVLPKSKKMIIIGENYQYQYNLTCEFSNCSYTSHPSVMTLWGNSSTVELKDKRGAFAGLSLFDQNFPVKNFDSLISHGSDENLISMSCSLDSVNRNYSSNTEIRIFDIRYPKESTMRIHSSIPVDHLLYFDKFLGSKSDHLLGFDSESNILRWEFEHSKNNMEHMDGTLMLTDVSKITHYGFDNLSDDHSIIGQAIAPSSNQNGAIFLMCLSSSGGIEYCKIVPKEGSNSITLDSHDLFQVSGNILDLSHLSKDYCNLIQTTSVNCSREHANAFGCISQSTFYLDFYWQELKSRIC